MDIDVEKERVSLGIKQLTKSSVKEDKFVNKTMTCVVEKIDEDKVIVSFEKNFKGFVKKSNLANAIATAKLTIERADALIFREQVELDNLQKKSKEYKKAIFKILIYLNEL